MPFTAASRSAALSLVAKKWLGAAGITWKGSAKS